MKWHASRLVVMSFVLLGLGSPDAYARATRIDANLTWASSAEAPRIPEEVENLIDFSDPGLDENLIWLLRSNRVEIDSDTVVTTSQHIIKYFSSEGLGILGEFPVLYDAGTDHVTVQQALVIDSLGVVHLVDPTTVQVIPHGSDQVFSDTTYAVIPFKGLNVGSVVVVRYTTTTKRDKLHVPWFLQFEEQSHFSQRKLEFEISWSSADLKPAWSSEYEGTVCRQPDDLSLICSATDLPKLPADPDVNYPDLIPHFTVAENLSWAEVSRYTSDLIASAYSGHPGIAATARRLTDGLETDLEKLEALHRFVVKEIRYLGLAHGRSAYFPHSTDATLSHRYGDCKDKTVLLIEMLDAIGIESHPVLVATDHRDPDKLEVPSGGYFDHLIACGDSRDGQQFCVDTTDPYTGVASLNPWLQGRVALPLSGDSGPVQLPVEDYSWSIQEVLKRRLEPDGSVSEQSEVAYGGGLGTSIRSLLTGLGEDDRITWAMDAYHNPISPNTDPEFSFSGIESINDDLVVSWTATQLNVTDPSACNLYAFEPAWLNQVLPNIVSSNQHHGYEFQGFRYSGRAILTVADIWEIQGTGPRIEFESDYGTMRRQYETRGNRVVVRTEVELPRAFVPLDELEKFNRFLEILATQNRLSLRAHFKR